jgi:hypothetical protein
MAYLHKTFFLPPVLSLYKLFYVSLVPYLLLKNVLWVFAILHRLIFWLCFHIQLNTQKSLVFLMVVPYKIVVD